MTSSEDEAWYECDSSDNDEPFWGNRRRWLDEHYDVLQQMYAMFLEVGRVVFGNAFMQFGGFHDFVKFVYEYTLNYDLLTHEVTPNVRALAPSSRGEHGLPSVQAGGNGISAPCRSA